MVSELDCREITVPLFEFSFFLDILTFEDKITNLSQNVVDQLSQLYR